MQSVHGPSSSVDGADNIMLGFMCVLSSLSLRLAFADADGNNNETGLCHSGQGIKTCLCNES